MTILLFDVRLTYNNKARIQTAAGVKGCAVIGSPTAPRTVLLVHPRDKLHFDTNNGDLALSLWL